MKVAHIADIHISDSRIEEFKEMLNDLGEDIQKHNPDLIVFSGDMFIHRDKLSPKQVQLTRKFFHEILKGPKILIIPGNHDASMSEQNNDSLTAIFSHDPNIKVYNHVADYFDIGDYRYHTFPFPSKVELVRLGIKDVSNILFNTELFNKFNFAVDKKNVLLYHGVLEGFSIFAASEEAIGVGKEMMIPESFWSKFDSVMAGHLHKYQQIENAVYSGCPFPLTHADSYDTGWVLWENNVPTFIPLTQKYPYVTVDLGSLAQYGVGMDREAKNRLPTISNLPNTRIRIKYTINQSQTGELDHSLLGKYYSAAKEIKIYPVYASDKIAITLDLDSFKDSSLQNVIDTYIKQRKYHPDVKSISDEIEKSLINKYSDFEEAGVHFKPHKLRINNFKCFGPSNPEIKFDELSPVVGVFGKNKTGKSALVEAIIWALFGTTLRNAEKTSIVRNGEKSCSVELEFLSQTTKYKISRTRDNGSPTLSLYRYINDKWIDISGATITATQKHICGLVGSLEIFVSTVYSPQNGIDRLVKKRPAERKQIILDCLQIDILKRRQEAIAKLKNNTNDKINLIKGKLVVLSEQLDRLISGRPADLIKEFQNLLRAEKISQQQMLSRLESLSGKVADYTELRVTHDEINKSLSEMHKELPELRKRKLSKESELERFKAVLSDKSVIDRGLQRLKIYKEEVDKYSKELGRITDRKHKKAQIEKRIIELSSAHDETIRALNESKQMLIQQLHGYKELDCPKIDCPLNAKVQKEKDRVRIKIDDVDSTITKTVTEQDIIINQLKESVLELENEISDSFYDGSVHMKNVSAYTEEEKNKWPELAVKVDSSEEIVNNMIELVVAYGRQIEDTVNKRDGLVVQRTKLAEKLATIDGYKHEVTTIRASLTETNNKISKYEAHISRCHNDLEDIKKLEKELTKVDTILKETQIYLTHCSKYAEIVSKKGVVFKLVDKALPTIEKFSQSLLADTTNGSIAISVDSGTNSDSVNIQIIDSKGKRDVLEGSGAEVFLVSLVLRAAMSHLLSLRTGSKVELFVIDEGMGVLDDEGIVMAKDLFKRLGNEFNQVLFITHVTELKDIAQSVIQITGNSSISTFEIKDKKHE